MTIQEALDYLEGARFVNWGGSGQINAVFDDKRKDYIVCEIGCACGEIATKNAEEYGDALIALLNGAAALPGLIEACKAAEQYIIAAHARELWNTHPAYDSEKARRAAEENPPPVVLQIRAAQEAAGVTGEK